MMLPLVALLAVTIGPPVLARVFDVPRWRSYPLDGRYDAQAPLRAGCAGARDLCPPNAKSSNPNGGNPVAGFASAKDYQWCHVVRDGDTAANIAARVTGDASRGGELLAANPEKPTAIDKSGVRDFAPGALCPRERLLFPKGENGWHTHIDQLGNPRGTIAPFPSASSDGGIV